MHNVNLLKSHLEHLVDFNFHDNILHQVYGDKDPDGFYRGECCGQLGFVPCNMVSEIQVEDEDTQQQLLQQGFLSTTASMDKIGKQTCSECHHVSALFVASHFD